MTDVMSVFPNARGKRSYQEEPSPASISPFSKKSRCDLYKDDYEKLNFKRTRTDHDNRMSSPQEHFSYNTQYYENLSKSLQELNNQQSNQIHELMDKINTLENSGRILQEENKILKKAVSIQDIKLKESQHQTQHLNNMLQQAAQMIAQLEKNNHSLREIIYRNNNSYGGGGGGGGGGGSDHDMMGHHYMPPPPPDVF